MNPIDALTAAACAYETIALVARRPALVPPISHLCWRWPVLGPFVVGSLTLHLLFGKGGSSFSQAATLG